MKISLIQSDLKWEDKSGNFRHLASLITRLNNKTDIVLLPEMFNTGFSMNPEKLSESVESDTLRWMKKISKDGNFGLCGSYMVIENKKYYNRWVFVSPENEYRYYDKRHLFSLSEETRLFSPGNSRSVFSFRGIRISPYICYDLRFPVWSRNPGDCDLIIYAANWPESRISVWDTLIKARAIENQCYVAGVNRIGIDGEGIKYCGHSAVIDPRGNVTGSGNANEECTITCDISLTELTDFRNKFPVLKDADSFSIET